ncbi:MAG: YkvA family protein [Spirosomataceae bacterium]
MNSSKSSASRFVKAILASRFYRLVLGKASKMVQNTASIIRLLPDIKKKVEQNGIRSISLELKENISWLLKLLKAFATREYTDIPTQKIIYTLAALLYFLLPIDILPDFLPVIGLADDIALLGFLWKNMEEEVTKFKDWKKAQTTH